MSPSPTETSKPYGKEKNKVAVCESCKTAQATLVISVPGVPYSAGYCQECLNHNSHPMGILIANTAAIGGLKNAAAWWTEMVMTSLYHQKKTVEWFEAEVQNSYREYAESLLGPPKEGERRNMNKLYLRAPKCADCIDCERMIGMGMSWRCYGEDRMGVVKRDLCEGENPPQVAPEWCPRREEGT